MVRKTMITLLTAAALTAGLGVDAFAAGGGGGHGGGGGGGHGGGFGGGGHIGGGFGGGGHIGGGGFGGGGHIGGGFGGAPRIGGSHFGGAGSAFARGDMRGHFGRPEHFEHGRRFVPGWSYGYYDNDCYAYPYYTRYSCDLYGY